MDIEVSGTLTETFKRGSVTLQQLQDFINEAQVAGVSMDERPAFVLGRSDYRYSYDNDIVKSISVPIPASPDLYAGPPPTTEVAVTKKRSALTPALVKMAELAPFALALTVLFIILFG